MPQTHKKFENIAPSGEKPLQVLTSLISGDDARNFEPKVRLKFENLDKSIQKLRAIYKEHPEWFEVPKPASAKGKNAVDYSV